MVGGGGMYVQVVRNACKGTVPWAWWRMSSLKMVQKHTGKMCRMAGAQNVPNSHCQKQNGEKWWKI